MAKRERLVTKRVNAFDGQRVTERDLDVEQIHNNALASNIVVDFHGSGVVKDSPFEETILLDTRFPSTNGTSDNPSQFDIESGNYDGKGISLDRQPTDPVRGNRLELSLFDSDVKGREKTKIMLLGRAFDGVDSQGELVAEFIEFGENGRMLTQHYYTSVISIFFNNFSGGLGRTEAEASKESLDLITETGGYMVIKEAEPLSVFPASRTSLQIESPNQDMINFITSSTSRSIEDEIELALGSSNSINDLYIELEGKDELSFEKEGPTSLSFGQKFLSKVNNIQRIDLLLSVERDTATGFDFSGDIVLSVHELVSEVSCPTDAVPNDLIDFDPETTPLVEISFGQEDLLALGYELTDVPQAVSFNFAGTLIADPNIEPTIKEDTFYAFLVSRRGDNRTGTIILEKGFDKVTKKAADGTPQTTVERFGKQNSKFVEFDPTTKRFVNDSQSSLWYVVHTDAIEVVNGTAYADTGVAVTVPKTVEFVGSTEISNFEKDIVLRTVAEGANNYVILSQIESFTDPNTHPRTNNFVFTRILDAPIITVANEAELEDIQEDVVPVILSKVVDRNVRDAQTLSGVFDKPGLIDIDTVLLVDPENDILLSNLNNRIITPDTDCDCNSRYRIARVDCFKIKAGDLDNDGKLTSSDISGLLDIVGNTINSETTEREILGGELDILDFIKSDLNEDGTIDGTDIELLEDAVDGYVNFTVDEEIRVLRLRLENVLESSDNPTIFIDTALSGSAVAATSNITFTTTTENEALIIRSGDTIEIPAPFSDAGTYIVDTKTIAPDGINVTLAVTDQDGLGVSFVGSTAFNVTITSGTKVNIFADNPDLVGVPFQSTNYDIDFIEAPFEEKFVDICDLRRLVGVSFLELDSGDECGCVEEECLPADNCQPNYKNQTYVPGDLFIPEGKILSAPGVPYHGDFEYTNIKLPLPPGSISDCSIDLYNNFIKSEGSSCLTSAGFPAMKYSDGTYVGCEDIGFDTDIAKGRVKLSHAVCGICVDALVDGYSDGYAEETETSEDSTETVEAISENFIDDTFSSFGTWTENGLNDTSITNIAHPSGSNQPAIFDLTTSSNSGERFGRLDSPIDVQNFSGDFIVDFNAARTTWQGTSLISGTVSSFATLVISNTDGSVSTLKLGWKTLGGHTTKMFYSGTIEDAFSTVISSFNFEIEAPDNIGDEVSFRFRRTNDVVSAYYIIPGRLTESTVDSFGQYVKIGTNPEMQPGSGTTSMSFEINQKSSPTVGLSFFTRLSEVFILSEYSSDDSPSTLPIGRDDSTGEIDRATLTFPINLPRRTSIISATLVLTTETAGAVPDNFNIIGIDLVNADNLGSIFNVPLITNPSLITTFSPVSTAIGGTLAVDVTVLFIEFLSQGGHLPGFIKGLIIEPDLTANSSFSISSEATLNVVYEDASTGIVFKVGVSLDKDTGIATFNTKNILFDALVEQNRTVLNFGVYLKKSGFKNQDVDLTIDDLSRLGIGTCFDEQILEEDEDCFFIVGSTAVGTFVEGPFPCQFLLP